jgi:hydrogenase maturation protein HypF
MRVLRRMIARGVNSPLTSSCGRLFDAVAAVVLGRRQVDYEAQAAIELEGLAIEEPYEMGAGFGYPMELSPGNWLRRERAQICTQPLWRELLEDLLGAGANPAKIAARFHAGIAAGFIAAAKMARESTGLRQVALTGGCMHNRRLARLLRVGLEAEGFEVYQHIQVSPGDAGLSYGQAVVATAALRVRQ